MTQTIQRAIVIVIVLVLIGIGHAGKAEPIKSRKASAKIFQGKQSGQTLPGMIYMTQAGTSSHLIGISPALSPVDPHPSKAGLDLPKFHRRSGYGFDVSRDGTEVVYLTDIKTFGVRGNVLRMVHLKSKKILDQFEIGSKYSWNAAPKLSFDKTKIATYAGYRARKNTGVTVWDRKGNEIGFFVANKNPRPFAVDWLPDGRLVFADGGEMYVTDVSLNKATLILSVKSTIGLISTSVEGMIAFHAGGHIFVCDSRGKNLQLVTYSGDKAGISEHSPAWSPDGKYIAFLVQGRSYGSNGSGYSAGSVDSLAIVKYTGKTHVVESKASRHLTPSGFVGGDNISGNSIFFVKRNDKGREFNLNVEKGPVWR